MIEKATFGAGCFWGVEEAFRKIKGVAHTTVGYSGGNFKNPTYEDVCGGFTGHAEVIQIEFDSNHISYLKLLKVFWSIHDPTTLNRQGPDVGDQYRSAIFFHSLEQEKIAKVSKEEEQKKMSKKIVTEITLAKIFYPAEEYHQRYHEKNGGGHCGF